MTRLLAAVVLLVALPLAAPATAADPTLAVSDVHVDGGLRSVDVALSASGLPSDVGLDPATVQVTVGERVLPATALIAQSETTTTAPTVLLVVDTSGSMQGTPMTEAKQAVSAFLSASPAETSIGLLQFSSAPKLLVAPTTERTRLLAAVAALQPQGETSLYDAILAGLRTLGGTGDRRLVVLSDGGDTRSKASLDTALTAAKKSGAVVDAIGFNTSESVGEVLRQIATSGRGKVHQASSAAELTAALATTVRRHARSLTVSVLIPEDLRGEQGLTFSVATAKGRLSAPAAVTLGAVDAPTAATTAGWWGTRDALLTGIAGIGLSLLIGTLVLFSGGRRDQKRVHAVLDRYTTRAPQPTEDVRTASPVVRTALELADKVATKRDLQERLALRLDRAAITMTPAEWLLLRAGIAFGTMLLMVLIGKGLITATLLGALAGTSLPAMVLRRKGDRRQRAFEDQLPDSLQMVAGSLSAGYSLAQALDGLVREGSQPMAAEMGRAIAESRLGVPIESTLDGVADRMDSRDFRWVVMAIRVQREVGGNLAGVLTTVSATMRERAMLRRHVRGLSAEGRLSAYILIGLPLFLALYMLTLRPEYIRPLYTTGLGIVMIIAAGLLLSIGSFWMSRMVKVEV